MINNIYTHYKNKKKYKIIDICKIQENDIWTDAIIYIQINNPNEKYVRKIIEFNRKFIQDIGHE